MEIMKDTIQSFTKCNDTGRLQGESCATKGSIYGELKVAYDISFPVSQHIGI